MRDFNFALRQAAAEQKQETIQGLQHPMHS